MSDTYPPGPKSAVPFRLFNRFRRDPLAFVEEFRGHGTIAHMSLAGIHVYLLSEDALLREVLLDTKNRFGKGRALNRAKALVGEGLLTSEPPLHTRQKRLMMPAFHREQIAAHADDMVAQLDSLTAAWPEGAEIELWSQMMRLTQAIAAKSLFGADVQAEADGLSSAINDLLEDFEVVGVPGAELLRWLPIPYAFRFHRAKARLDGLVYGLIRRRQNEAESGSRRDLLSLLLQARDEDGGAMDEKQVRDEVMTLFLAGHETTSNALLWAWRLLLEHPQALAGLQQEVDSVLGSRAPGAADFPRLEVTRQTLAEAMRLYPPAWTVSRLCRQAIELGGWKIPKGSILLMSQWLMHRDPRFWEDPLAFRPQRHSEAARSQRSAFAYFPFGAGPRGCIGEGFAWMEGVLLLARMAQQWRFEHEGPWPQPQALITLRPRGGMKVRAFRR